MNREALTQFVGWARKNITGDEKGQAQIFLDRLFQAFGQAGCLDVAKCMDVGQPVTAPGFPDPQRLVTGDCIQPPALETTP